MGGNFGHFPDIKLRSIAELLPVTPDRLPPKRLLALLAPVPLDVGVQPARKLLERHAGPVPPAEEVALERAEEPLAPRVVGAAGLAGHRARDVAGLARPRPVAARGERPPCRVTRSTARGRFWSLLGSEKSFGVVFLDLWADK